MTNGDVPESYGVCDECKNPIDWPEQVTYLFDKPVHTKCYPNEGEIQRRLNSHTCIALQSYSLVQNNT